jgi:hypothetical protein
MTPGMTPESPKAQPVKQVPMDGEEYFERLSWGVPPKQPEPGPDDCQASHCPPSAYQDCDWPRCSAYYSSGGPTT